MLSGGLKVVNRAAMDHFVPKIQVIMERGARSAFRSRGTDQTEGAQASPKASKPSKASRS
jgi:hypothetical protein